MEEKTRKACEKIAGVIADEVALSKSRDYELLPSEMPDTAERWISNFAEGVASGGTLTHQEAIDGIRSAFESMYGMSPEAYHEAYDPRQMGGVDPAKGRALEKAARQEAECARDRESDRDFPRER